MEYYKLGKTVWKEDHNLQLINYPTIVFFAIRLYIVMYYQNGNSKREVGPHPEKLGKDCYTHKAKRKIPEFATFKNWGSKGDSKIYNAYNVTLC